MSIPFALPALSALTRPVAVIALASAACAAHAVTVSATSSAVTAVGAVVAGQTYSVTASGIANLYVGFSGGLGLTFTANGLPTYAFAAPYAAFYPGGLDYDPSVGTSSIGPGGTGRLLGAVLGSFKAAPTQASDYFVIGLGTSFTAASSGTLYALVNDTYYADNGSGYNVVLSAVPEPAGALLLSLGAVALMLRRRAQVPSPSASR